MVVFTACLTLCCWFAVAAGTPAADVQTSPAGNLFYFDEDVTLSPTGLDLMVTLPASSPPQSAVTPVQGTSQSAAVSQQWTSSVTTIITTQASSAPFVLNETTSESPRPVVSTLKPTSSTNAVTAGPTQQRTTSPAASFPPALAKDPIGTRFFLFTRFHSNSPYVLDQNSEDSLRGAFFTFCYNANNKRLPSRDKKMYIVIHGLSDGFEVTNWMKTMKNRLLDTDREANVVLVDWSKIAAVNLLNDLKFSSIRIVGQQIVQLIRGLQFLYPATFSPDNIHIIAHSFGTFAADVVGRNINRVARITGLDPAGGVTNLHTLPLSQRLDASDAQFVDVIHTDAPRPADAPLSLNSGSSLLPSTIVLPGSNLFRAPAAAAAAAIASGTIMDLGHFDFYPNGGYSQPGCNALATSPAASFLRPLLPAVTLGGTQSAGSLKKLLSCSHSRAIDLFIESIRAHDAPGCGLIAYSCSNYTAFLDGKCTLCKEGTESGGEACVMMGFHAVDSFDPENHAGNRKFYLTTNSRALYCLYHYGVAVKIAKKPRNSARGGVLIAALEGEYASAFTEPNLEVKLLGGLNAFRPGKTVRAMFTHFTDCGAIKSAVVSWVPAPPNLSHLLSSSQSLHVQALRVHPMSFADATTRNAISRTLCPPTPPLSGFLGESYSTRTDPPVAVLSAFFKEVEFSASRCTHHNQPQQQQRLRDADAPTASDDINANERESDDDE